jgi:hypothetical protein
LAPFANNIFTISILPLYDATINNVLPSSFWLSIGIA